MFPLGDLELYDFPLLKKKFSKCEYVFRNKQRAYF